ncbi:lytic transglycosylase domain-containing protein [Marinobacter alkaliphilus]|uniref:Lytic transglycosylase domain-containing protein n=1 Tax=Marinobacter alkaliphilus TaxID=254719 RepID=A0ABZ3E966_9GAMM
MILTIRLFLVASGLALVTMSSSASEALKGTIWETANLHGVPIELLYAVALQESRLLSRGLARPDPYVIRDGATIYRPKTFHEAREILSELLVEGRVDERLRQIDVGMLQINLYWHKHRIEEFDELLIPAINIAIGSEILSEALNSSASSIEIQVGRYHSWTPDLARNYGKSVIGMACGIGWSNATCGGVGRE